MTNLIPKRVHRKGILSLSTLQNLPSHSSTIVDQDTIRNTDDGSTLGITRTAKTAGTAKVTTTMARLESTKPESTATPSIIRVLQRVLLGDEVLTDGRLWKDK
ncbi:uncharacterized protein LOC143174977 [Nomia melanderi]|uniref:uncharacterized protein LOC143174977 n=1 Tax=Nomia melanderi TaxID=2448451 RepID=UPI003FCE6318